MSRLSQRARLLSVSLLAACVGMVAPLAARTPLATEPEPVLDAASLVQPALLSGPGFQVDPHVELRGYMARFTLDTDFGPLHAPSVEVLAIRVAELPALEALDRVTRSEAFIEAAGDRLGDTARALGRVLWNPIDSVLGLPAGVGRYFGRRLQKVRDQAQGLSDRTARTFGQAGEAHPMPEGPMTEARRNAEGPPREKAWHEPVTGEGAREVRRQLRFNQVRRELAERLGIDPYTDNPLVQERLSSLAWLASGGHFAAGAALGSVGGVGAVVLARGSQVNELVWKLPPEDLRKRNAERLEAWCGDAFQTRQFLRLGAFPPALQTGLVDALSGLQPEAGCDALLDLALAARSQLEARFLVNALRMLVAHGSRGGALQPVGAGLVWVGARGSLVLPLPVDRLSWTDEVREFLDGAEFHVADKTVLIGGDASIRARRGLAERGWNVHTRFSWPGAPPYAPASAEPAPQELGE